MSIRTHKPNRLVWFALAAMLCLSLSGRVYAQTSSRIAEPFRSYYSSHEGQRVLGLPVSDLIEVEGYQAQYFEKGRIEHHGSRVADNTWAFMYGRLTVELIERSGLKLKVSSTEFTYAELRKLADPKLRVAPPPGFSGGTGPAHDGMFVPFDSQLRPARGYVVAPYFWAYINRSDLFPGGWLHDIGLPLTDTFNTTVAKSGGEIHTIFVQAFERAVLTYDMRNPAGWQVERGNIGADAWNTEGTRGYITP